MPQSTNEWLELLKQQEELHDEELNRWQEILGTSIALMDQMKGTLAQLKNTIDNRASLVRDLNGAKSSTDRATKS